MRGRNVVNLSDESKDYFWRKRPSEIRGYNRTFYINSENGDYIRVDYNLKDRIVRIYIEDFEEGGNPYYSVISNGKIAAERNATSGRAHNLKNKISQRATILTTIPNRDVLKLINNNYGIKLSKVTSVFNQSLKKKINFEQTRKKYFRKEDIAPQYVKIKNKKQNFKIIDFIDFLIGIFACLSLYIYEKNFVTLGVLSAFIGIFIGLLDVFYREREIILTKMLFFLLIGAISYIYGYYIF